MKQYKQAVPGISAHTPPPQQTNKKPNRSARRPEAAHVPNASAYRDRGREGRLHLPGQSAVGSAPVPGLLQAGTPPVPARPRQPDTRGESRDPGNLPAGEPPGQPRGRGGRAAVAMTTSRGRENFKSQPSVQERLPLKGARTHRHTHTEAGSLPPSAPQALAMEEERRGGGQPPALTARTTRSRDKRTRAEKRSRSAVSGGTQRPQAKP